MNMDQEQVALGPAASDDGADEVPLEDEEDEDEAGELEVFSEQGSAAPMDEAVADDEEEAAVASFGPVEEQSEDAASGMAEEPVEGSEEAGPMSESVDGSEKGGDEEPSASHSETGTAPEQQQAEPERQPDDGEGAATSEGDSQEQPESVDPEKERAQAQELTKKYLMLLNAGKLASKKKEESAGPKKPSARTVDEVHQDMARSSVYQSILAEMQASGTRTAEVERVFVMSRATQQQQQQQRPSSSHSGGSQEQQASPSQRSPRQTRGSKSPQAQGPPERRSTSPFGHGGAATYEPRAGTPCGGVLAQLGAGGSSASPFSKIYSPGPGAYSPSTDRKGRRDGSAFSFGSARQRPPHVCIHDAVVSPGPVYLPGRAALSTGSLSARYVFPRAEVATRFDPSASMPSNCPHWTPGPGTYQPAVLPKGSSREPGQDVPRYSFPKQRKMIRPEDAFSGTVFLSQGHALKENVNVHSPGPARYGPDVTPIKPGAAAFSMGRSAPSYFDAVLDPVRQPSPGPVYQTGERDRRGGTTWDSGTQAPFGRASKYWEPQYNLSATTFITSGHATKANHGVHSPGPVYLPSVAPVKASTQSAVLNTGPKDRFYNRFEPGRLG